ncbi:uncharacterized protein [Elaeis guineensis]|uniref:Uncharacterized protein LOC105055733 n=1 Tax=Elaeis guineensis var. tenera TaxID=51953 RepID=A0A6I9S2K7_ELAGV|nr:uncharacterized protein LOC105055733 [Elaeis guineensis]
MDLKGKGLFYGDDKFPTEYDDGTVNCALRLGSTPTLKLQSAGEATLRQPQVLHRATKYPEESSDIDCTLRLGYKVETPLQPSKTEQHREPRMKGPPATYQVPRILCNDCRILLRKELEKRAEAYNLLAQRKNNEEAGNRSMT